MGVIQNAINQTIGTAGIVARLSPNFEKKAELKKLEKKEKILQERLRMQKTMQSSTASPTQNFSWARRRKCCRSFTKRTEVPMRCATRM